MRRRLFPKLFLILAAGSLALAISRCQRILLRPLLKGIAIVSILLLILGQYHGWRYVTDSGSIVTGEGIELVRYGQWNNGRVRVSEAFGVHFVRQEGFGFITVPPWLVFVIAAASSVPWVRQTVQRRLRQRRSGSGLCMTCGYDLRAHSAGQVCPECGTPVPGDLMRRALE